MQHHSFRLLSMWLEWHQAGIDIGLEKVKALEEAELVTSEYQRRLYSEKEDLQVRVGRDFTTKNKQEIELNELFTVQKANEDAIITENIYESEEFIRRTKDKTFSYSGKSKIKRADWDFEFGEKFNYSKEFFEWINSVNSGWQNRTDYYRFNLYKQQAAEWLAQTEFCFNPLDSEEEQLHYLRIEMERCKENTLYGLNKFLFLKDGQIETGRRRYEAWESQAATLMLFDLGLCIANGKLRQVGLTSTLVAAAMMRTMLRRQYFCKFVTEKDKKGVEIYDDKAKFALNNFADYMVPTVSHEQQAGLMRFSVKESKGRLGGGNSKFMVEAPYETVVNGGSPDLILIDEGGNIPIIGDIINQGRPTLFWVNPLTGQMELKRQMITWGTGGNMEKGGHAYEAVMTQAMEAWMDKHFEYCLVPWFLNAYAKPGITKKFLETERALAYSKQGTEGEKARRNFHQTYPLTLSDMFVTSLSTIMSQLDIEENMQRCRKAETKAKKGYFEPIFDMRFPLGGEDSYVKHKIVGARFIPMSDEEIINSPDKVVVTIYDEPEKGWKYRYFHGTDPIFSASGKSKMASTIWDVVKKKISAAINHRDNDYRYCYLQHALLNVYYGNPDWLLEINVGSGFRDFLSDIGLSRYLIANAMLPESMQTTGNLEGIKKTAGNAKLIINKLEEICLVFKNSINSFEFFYQLKTFVKKMNNKGGETWEPLNGKIHFDDFLDCTVYAYIASLCFAHQHPKNLGDKGSDNHIVTYRRSYDDNYNLGLRKVKLYNDGRKEVLRSPGDKLKRAQFNGI